MPYCGHNRRKIAVKVKEKQCIWPPIFKAEKSRKKISWSWRRRGYGRIVAIGFIDMHDKENNKILYMKTKEFMRSDR